jgi:AAHS family cis,cis-muconate transporter-like MFS transporter
MSTRTSLTRSSESQHTNTWGLVFILSYLALLADGADVMMYGLTLTRIKDEFGLKRGHWAA